MRIVNYHFQKDLQKFINENNLVLPENKKQYLILNGFSLGKYPSQEIKDTWAQINNFYYFCQKLPAYNKVRIGAFILTDIYCCSFLESNLYDSYTERFNDSILDCESVDDFKLFLSFEYQSKAHYTYFIDLLFSFLFVSLFDPKLKITAATIALAKRQLGIFIKNLLDDFLKFSEYFLRKHSGVICCYDLENVKKLFLPIHVDKILDRFGEDFDIGLFVDFYLKIQQYLLANCLNKEHFLCLFNFGSFKPKYLRIGRSIPSKFILDLDYFIRDNIYNAFIVDFNNFPDRMLHKLGSFPTNDEIMNFFGFLLDDFNDLKYLGLQELGRPIKIKFKNVDILADKLCDNSADTRFQRCFEVMFGEDLIEE